MIAIVLPWLVLIVGGLAALMFADIVLQRVRSLKHELLDERRRRELLPVFVKYICGDITLDETSRLVGRSTGVAQEIILDYLKELKGDARDKLLFAATELGLLYRTLRGLSSIDWTARDLSAMRLGIYGLEETVPDLVSALADQRMEVRYSAARSLGMIGSPQAVEALVQILDYPHLLDRPRVMEIVQSMASQVHEPLKRLLTGDVHTQEAKLLAIDLVGDLRDYTLVDTLHEILRSSNNEKVVRSVKAMGKIGSPRSIPDVLRLASSPVWEVRAQAMKAIGLMEIEDGIQLLREGLSDKAYWVRRNAADALIWFGQTGFDVLRQSEAESDEFARDMAAYQLERLNGHASSGIPRDIGVVVEDSGYPPEELVTTSVDDVVLPETAPESIKPKPRAKRSSKATQELATQPAETATPVGAGTVSGAVRSRMPSGDTF